MNDNHDPEEIFGMTAGDDIIAPPTRSSLARIMIWAGVGLVMTGLFMRGRGGPQLYRNTPGPHHG